MKRTEKDLFRDFMSNGGRLWKGKVLAPFPSVVFHRLLGTCSFLKIVFVFVCFEIFCLLYYNSCISPQECDKAFLKLVLKVWCENELNLSKYLRTIYLLEKGRSFPPFL